MLDVFRRSLTRQLLAVGLLLTWLGGCGAQAATFATDPRPDCTLLLSGEIRKGDAAAFEAFLKASDIRSRVRQVQLCLDSPGGNLQAALQIAEFIMSKGIGTAINDGDRCLSACALVFMTGTAVEADATFIRRRLHVNGVLGFHRPEIRVADGEYTSSSVARSFDIAVTSVLKIVEIANNRPTSSPLLVIKPALLRQMLLHRGNDFYYIDTTGRAGKWNIGIFGSKTTIRDIDRNMAFSLCRNTTGWKSNATDTGLKSEGFSEGEVLPVEITGKAVGKAYLIEVNREDAQDLFCFLYVDRSSDPAVILIPAWSCPGVSRTGGPVDAAKLVGCDLSRVYLDADILNFFPERYKLADLARERIVDSSADIGIHVSFPHTYRGFDVVGSDLEITRNVDRDTCSSSCLSDRQCVAYTFDVWNRICVSKATATEIRLDPRGFSEAKSDDRLPKLATEIVMRTRRNRYFPDPLPYREMNATRAVCSDTCMKDADCMGFNHAAGEQTCQLFDFPAEYQPKHGVAIGYKEQAAP